MRFILTADPRVDTPCPKCNKGGKKYKELGDGH